MPYGYRFLESIWDRKKKEKFLGKNLDEKEKFRYQSLDYTVKIGLVACMIYLLILITINKKFIFNYLVVILGLAVIIGSLIRQEYRTIKLIKYKYFKKHFLLKNKTIRILWIVLVHLVIIIGLIYLIQLLIET
ncbi:hypothetical protein KAJ87_01640 [Candidatus Pacearchaeota archaeon]|nr:hypothetical protein [Candidatus Pacearchaeota archaeon]